LSFGFYLFIYLLVSGLLPVLLFLMFGVFCLDVSCIHFAAAFMSNFSTTTTDLFSLHEAVMKLDHMREVPVIEFLPFQVWNSLQKLERLEFQKANNCWDTNQTTHLA
jgi:hypothetical protein